MSREYENFRVQLKKKFENKHKELIEKASKYDALVEENKELRIMIIQLQSELSTYNERLEQLVSHMGLSEDELKKLIEQKDTNDKLAELVDLLHFYGKSFYITE